MSHITNPKRASRGSVKDAVCIPYTSTSPFLSSHNNNNNTAAASEGTHWRKSSRLFSRMASAVAQKILHAPPPALTYGDILRDVPFHTHNRIVSFFSTHASLCEAEFGVSHGQCLRLTQGAWRSETAVVVGARGGTLWIVGSSGPATAFPLQPVEKHKWEKIAVVPELVQKLREGLEAARRDVDLDYTVEQREFLQKAPDLFMEVVDDSERNLVFTSDMRWSIRRYTKRHRDNNNNEDGDDSSNSNGGNDPDTDDIGSADNVVEQSRRSVDGNNDNNNNESVTTTSMRGDKKSKRVVLVPQVVQSTGDLGWAGEGIVVVNAGGVESFAASLSASVLL
ncbi:hypothetical protein LSM04_003850 [Trypanosoma melophagium]|uniref:uncharacterized protein n=1 Tax=Trypanosoma melophagium TaxID=715481 RepID=UPI00351A1CEE|nr:hypothetical protein LSM04_003850 [Trypanosoma melophagium]